MPFVQQQEVVEEETEKVVEEFGPNSIITARIKSLSRSGIMTLLFDQDLKEVPIQNVTHEVLEMSMKDIEGNVGRGLYIYESDSSADSTISGSASR